MSDPTNPYGAGGDTPYGNQPAYGAQPTYGTQASYGTQPAYSQAPAGQQPAYGGPAAYNAGAAYGAFERVHGAHHVSRQLCDAGAACVVRCVVLEHEPH